ncbi:MAG TPA: hypothetical protein PLJ84_01130 [Bacteroidales bacterium]|nr:hypothetical protein [Bacteroidales bacterium]
MLHNPDIFFDQNVKFVKQYVDLGFGGRLPSCRQARKFGRTMHSQTNLPPRMGRNSLSLYFFFTDVLPLTGQSLLVFILRCFLLWLSLTRSLNFIGVRESGLLHNPDIFFDQNVKFVKQYVDLGFGGRLPSCRQARKFGRKMHSQKNLPPRLGRNNLSPFFFLPMFCP